ncbi:MAG: hypothetical protein KGI49_03600 [Patescibacteria group bacterium]|nr:hypothetical protein [Patescibacteria group bacterium]
MFNIKSFLSGAFSVHQSGKPHVGELPVKRPFVIGVIAGVTGALLLAAVIFIVWITAIRPAGVSGIRVVYSLDARQNDKEIIHLIDSADKYVYFAVYYFTVKDIADALVRAKNRGVEVRGITDAAAAAESGKGIVAGLRAAGILLEVQKHQDGIMHIKAIVTDKAYASGSYNWTAAATNANDEVLEIGTDPAVREQYLAIVKKVIAANGGSETGDYDGTYNAEGSSTRLIDESPAPTYDYTQAPEHIGERATVMGTVYKAYTAKSGTTFLDFCPTSGGGTKGGMNGGGAAGASNYDCPFSAVIFKSAAGKFGDFKQYERHVSLTGIVSSYQGGAEMILEEPGQVE